MRARRQSAVIRSWADSIAGSMSDPVKRLRFLRAVAPLANVAGERRWLGRGLSVGVLAIVLAAGALSFSYVRASAQPPAPAMPPAPPAHDAAPATLAATDVWLVEQNAASEVYSNGLRIDSTFAVGNGKRSYLAFPVGEGGPPATRSDPAGIVFHGTESLQVPFEASRNEKLKRVGESLLAYVQRRRSYNFVIDRFGRVHRIVRESDAADHAGYSAWSDDRWLYLNLNESFLGVALEARTAGSASEALMTAAQTRSAAMLTEMLRARYRIPASNCVTHAQVSLNPSNMRIGYHVDWASDFPFAEVGLPDNYATPIPALWLLGFDCDPSLRGARGIQAGIVSAEAIVQRAAASRGEKLPAWRRTLQQSYRQKLALVRHAGS